MDNQTLYSRDQFLSLIAKFLLLGGFLTTGLASLLYFLKPINKSSNQAIFDAGLPSDYPLGVSQAFIQPYLTWIVREPEGFYALKAVCTHMSCQPNWNENHQIFHCPCHNSQFQLNGLNISGPAPRPLERLKIFLDNGRLKIDRGYIYRQEKGEWKDPDSFLVYQS